MADLPDLPDHASGILCTTADGIDRTNPNFMRERLDAIIENSEIFDKGWRVESRGYSTMGVGEHHNLVLLNPDGKIFASLDTQQISRENGAIKGYFPDGEFSAPVMDDCTLGNLVVKDDNHIGALLIKEGTGTEALLAFAKGAEAAREAAEANYTYKIFPDSNENEGNSNSLSRLYTKAASDGAMDNSKAGYSWRSEPGMDVDLYFELPQTQTSFYDSIKTADHIVNDPKYYQRLLSDLKELHPITQQERSIEFGKAEAAAPQEEGITGREVWSVVEGVLGLPRP